MKKQDTYKTKTWTLEGARATFDLPFPDLMYQAQTVHREHFNPNEMQTSTLLSIKTGVCPENCAYCPQSVHYKTGIKKEPLVEVDKVVHAAKCAKEAGSTRFCVGAAWRGPRQGDLQRVCEMIRAIKKIGGLETCASLGLLQDTQAEMLKEAGLDFYNHNIDTSASFYSTVITTRTFQDRLDTIERVRQSGMKICSGGIVGMGESTEDLIKMLVTLANFVEPPTSVPINRLIRIPGTPLEHQPDTDPLDFVRTIAVARILLPRAYVRLSAGRESMSDELQSLSFLAGANSIFYGKKLLTTPNPTPHKDDRLLQRLGIHKLQLPQKEAVETT